MAPKKKEEKASAGEAADMVLHYIRTLPKPESKQNRPYSAIEVSANLHNKVTKSGAAKILKDLHEQKQIEGRTAGKQIVYHAIQDANDTCTSEQFAALDTQIADLRAQTAALNDTAKALRATLSSLNAEVSTAGLMSQVRALEAERSEVMARLDTLRKGKAKRVDKEEREKVDKEWSRIKGVAKRRGRIVEEMWKMIEDCVESSETREELRERFEIDG